MKRFRTGEAGINLVSQLDLLSDGVSYGLFEVLVADAWSAETYSGSFIGNKARAIGGILAARFFEKLARMNMAYLR